MDTYTKTPARLKGEPKTNPVGPVRADECERLLLLVQ
jgi:hypothetical protein